MIRSFLEQFEAVFENASKKERRDEAVDLARQFFKNTRTHPEARVPAGQEGKSTPLDFPSGRLFGTILTGEMFAPILGEQIERFNKLSGSRLKVVAVANTYFGGDVSVAGLLSGQDLVAAADRVGGDFVIIPRVTIKSDEPIFIDGMAYDDLKSRFAVPVFDLDTDGLIKLLQQ